MFESVDRRTQGRRLVPSYKLPGAFGSGELKRCLMGHGYNSS